MIQQQLRATLAHTHIRTHTSDTESGDGNDDTPPARMRTTAAASELKHVRDSIETLRGATPTIISVTGTFHNPLITTTTTITLKAK